VVQRAPITEDQAREALAQRAPAFVGSDIVQPWDSDWDSNCHGYTVTEDPTRALEGDDLLANVGNAAIMVFVRNGAIAHSGRIVGGGQLQHLLIGIGVVRTAINGAMGYEHRFILPEERDQLVEYVAPRVRAQEREREIYRMVRAAYRAPEYEGGQALRDQVFALQDGNGNFDEVAAAFATFAELHPEILQADHEDGDEGSDEY
jgi:hypothetical protein